MQWICWFNNWEKSLFSEFRLFTSFDIRGFASSFFKKLITELSVKAGFGLKLPHALKSGFDKEFAHASLISGESGVFQGTMRKRSSVLRPLSFLIMRMATSYPPLPFLYKLWYVIRYLPVFFSDRINSCVIFSNSSSHGVDPVI